MFRRHLRSMEKHKNKPSHTNSQGHTLVKLNNKWVYEHRHIWETEQGPLPKGSAVWHINDQLQDNRLRNLIALKRNERGLLLTLRGIRITELEKELETLKDKIAVLENKSFEEIVKELV